MTPLNLDPNQNYLTPYTPPVDVPEWRKSLGSFAKETSALGSGLVALGAQTLGLEEAQDNALADYQRSMQEAGSGWMTPEVGQIEDIKLTESGGLGRLGSYLGYQVPKGIAQLGSLVVGGLGTGAVAKAVASKGIKELAKAEMKNLAADVAAKGAAGMVAKQVATPLVERAAGQEAIKQLAKRQVLGTQVGVGAGALGMETGQMYGKLATDPEVGPDKATAPAVLYGGVAAALEYLPLHMAGQALGLDRLLLRKVIKADPVLAQQAANLNLAQKAAKLGGKALKGAAAGAAVEGITEGMQNLVEQAATKYAQEDSQWASVLPTTKEGWSDFWNNVAAGAAVGGVAGAALGPMARTQQRPTGEVSEQEPEATRGPAAEAGAPIRVPLPGGQAPAEAPAPAPGAATAEGIADVLSMPGGPEAGAAALGQGAAATPATPTAEQPPSEPAGGEVQGAVAPQGGGMVVDTTSPQQAPIIPEVPRAQQDASPAALYENVPSPEQQGGQEVQLPAEEGGERVLPGGQEVKEVIGKADGTPFASRDAATRRLNQLWAQGGMQIQEGPEAGKQARTRVAKQGDGYVIERLESRTEPQVLDTDSTGKLVHPTPEGRANFKEWFTGSKVVDGEGRPLRVYRGDKDSSFTEFNVESLGQNTKTLGSKLGFFFTPNYDFAAAPQFGGNIRSFYLGAKKPYLVPVVDGQLEADARIQGYKEFNVDSEELLRKKLVDAGYDSIMYAGYPSNQQAELIALDPTVIKSIRNRGTYEQGNPNILESRATAPVHSTIDFVAATDAVLGQGWTQRAIDAGILQVNETSAAGSASGYFDKGTGRLTINLDRTPQGFSVADVVLHEGSHSGLARMLGGQFNSFHQDLQTLADRGSATARLAILQATEGAIGAINRQRTALGAEPFPHRLGDETLPVVERTAELKRVRDLINEQNPGLLPEEDLAYYVQLASSAKPAEVGYWHRLMTAIQAWFAGTDFGKALAALGWRPELSPQLAVALATRAAQQTLQRAELVNRLVGERAKVLRGLPAGARLGVMESQQLESRASTISPFWWRSGVATAIAAAPQQKAAPQQWVGWLKNQPGVKQEEIEDLGLEDWLLAQEGSVQKADVEKFVRDGGVRIEEVLKGKGLLSKADFIVWNDRDEPGKWAVVSRYDLNHKARGGFNTEEAARKWLEFAPEDYGLLSTPKFATYQVPGGENYRELLITVPTVKEENGQLSFNPNNQYRSSHWSEPNVLVHIRFNERQDISGKRVLFVEEVQSDWGQEGRKRGYDTPKMQAQRKRFARLNRLDTQLANEGLAPEELTEYKELQQEFKGILHDYQLPQGGVPNMPLKSAWPLLGMKRAIRWAAEHGFDSVAWLPGDPQAQRYKEALLKEVDQVTITKYTDGTYEYRATKEGRGVASEESVSAQRVQDVFGKAGEDLVRQADATPAKDVVVQAEDLTVGGEGMRGFYDKMLPSMLSKYGKKFGAKVGETTVAKDRPGYDVIRVSDGASMATIGSLEGANGEARLLTESTGQEHITRPNSTSSQAVWSLPITPALRDEALAGQLLYSLPPMSSWELPHSWFTSPVSTYPEDFNVPGTFNKVFHGMVDRFNYVKDKSPELYRAFDEWKNRQGALQQEIQRTYLDPLRHWVSRYQPPPSDSEPIRRTEIEAGKVSDPNQKYTTVEIVGHQLAVRHILLDNVTEQLALKASLAFLKELKKQLSPTNVGLLNADIKLETGGSLAIAKLTNDQARMLLERYLPSANPKSDIGLRWTLYNRRSAGYSIATPGSIEAIDDAKEGFINAHELYTPQIAGRETFQKIAELSDKLAAHQLAMLQEGGLLQQADVDRLGRAYPHFVPLRREAFDYDRELAEMFEKPRANIGKLMTRDGSTEFASAVHVLQNHLAAGFTSASAAARNQMMNKFYDVLNADRQGWRPWFRISEKRDNNGAMGLIRNGKTLYLVPADGNIRAASIAKVITGRDAEQLSGPFKVMRSINNWIRWSNVSASPAFMLANTPRDYLTAVYNLQASEAATYAKEIASWTNYKESFKALKKVIVDGVRETTDPEIQSWIDLVEDFEKSGGKTSFVEALRAMDGDSWRSFEAQVGRREGKHGAVVEYGREKLEWLENLNITLENVMRLSTYKVMRDKVGKERAAEIARNLTTNFTRRGAHIDAINTWWLFYNATVQGNWQVVQNLFLNPNKAGQRRLQRAVAGTILFAFMIDQLGRAFSDDEDDDGISDWDSVPAHEKERKIRSPFKIGGTYLSIPAPWVFNIFWRMGGMLGEVKDGVLKPQDAVLDSIALTASAMDPVGGLRALSGDGTLAQAISPSAFDPFMQMIENRDFMGNPLGPDGYPGASKRPDAYLAWDSTPKGFKTAAQFVNEVTGGSAVESGTVDLRPSSLKMLADFAMGGLGRSLLDLGKLGLSPFTDAKEFEGLEEVPLAKVFLSAPSDSTAISLYHDRVAQVLGSERLVKFYSEGPEKNPQKLAQVQQDRAALLRMVPQVDDTERQIKSLRKTLRSAQARGDSRTEEQLRDRIVQLQKRFNSSYSRRIGN